MPQAPSQYHPVRAKERVTERRNYVLREMFENGVIDEPALMAALNEPLKSVQNGDYPAFREALPPRDYFTDEIRRQLSPDFGEQELFGGGLTIRATIDRELQAEAAAALRDGLEKFDRSPGHLARHPAGDRRRKPRCGKGLARRAGRSRGAAGRARLASGRGAGGGEIRPPGSASRASTRTRMAISSRRKT
ncbi:MAG: hypothetical protein MZV49_25060 [Rhodopseudomonas palustris]|nr:hypothetical protein [Rhodopseudomonas palustris]